MVKIILFLIVIEKVIYLYGLKRQDLNGNWTLYDQNRDYVSINATVPGGIYSDLINNEIIDDVFYSNNDIKSRWVAKRNWIYSKVFIVEESILQHENINIVFDGVDTFSTIFINDEQIGITDNMFVRYIFSINKHLKEGENNVTVKLESPVNAAKKIFKEQSTKYVIPPKCIPNYYNGICHVNLIRKMQASFGWDWSPALPSVGIWKNVYIEAYNSSLIQDITVKTILNTTENTWNIRLRTYFVKPLYDIKGNLKVTLLTDKRLVSYTYKINLTQNDDGEYMDQKLFSISKFEVQLWWPNGFGNATLYPLTVTYINENIKEKDYKQFKIGFRTIYLNQHRYYIGRAFNFFINDIPIFAKGSNLVPINILPEKNENATKIRWLLKAVKDVNMNMIKVWGGGIYQSNEFYNVADEFGIMIWQDFMFACSMYPTTDNFLRTVKEEVKQQVRRLQYHTSIVIWTGNNENEVALRENWYGTSRNFSLYKADYIKLYIDTIKHVLLKNDDTREFLTSTPTNGIESDEVGYVAQNPHDSLYGDIHFYNNGEDSWDPNIYPIPRFASEYGYQSLPQLRTLLTISDNIQNLGIDGELMTHRQHFHLGYLKMHILINQRLNIPPLSGSIQYLKTITYYSQIMQAMAVKIETEYYRQWRSIVDDKSRGLTSGALYWQLNDVWVAPSWSSIDYEGNWKMLHYFAKDFFAPIIVTGHLKTENDLDIYVINDNNETYYNVSVVLDVYKWDNMTPVSTIIFNILTLSNVNSVKVESLKINNYLTDEYCGLFNMAIVNCFMYFSITDGSNQALGPSNFVFPVPLNMLSIHKPNLMILSVNEEEDKNIKIQVKTDIVALFVWLDSGNIKGRFSKNGFLQVKEVEDVYFFPESPTNSSELKDTLTITCLTDKGLSLRTMEFYLAISVFQIIMMIILNN